MDIFLSSGQRVVTCCTVGSGPETMQLFHVIFDEDSLETDVDHVCGNVENIDRVGKITKNVDEGFGHFASHVQVGILTLK